MIYINLEGRLGNNLWQIAAAATLAERLGESFCAVPNRYYHCPEPDNCNFLDYIQQFKSTIFRNVHFVDECPSDTYYCACECDLTTITTMPAPNIRLEGYFQDVRFISEKVVQSLFAPTEEIIQQLHSRYPILQHIHTYIHTCAIVVRRGDYLKLPMQFPVEDMAYYRKCIKRLEKILGTKDIRYLIISDDESWCRENFVGEQYTIVENEPPLIDLYISSMCKHTIISNSSFAVWGGLLNMNSDKQILYPDPWHGIGMRRIDKHGSHLSKDWHKVRHYSKAYVYGVWLWIKNGLTKKLLRK